MARPDTVSDHGNFSSKAGPFNQYDLLYYSSTIADSVFFFLSFCIVFVYHFFDLVVL